MAEYLPTTVVCSQDKQCTNKLAIATYVIIKKALRFIIDKNVSCA